MDYENADFINFCNDMMIEDELENNKMNDNIDQNIEDELANDQMDDDNESNIIKESVDEDLNVSEGELLIMAFALRHQLSDCAIEDLLRLIDIFSPKRVIPISSYLFLKKFKFKSMEIQRTFFCRDCEVPLTPTDLKQKKIICNDCGTEYDKTNLLSKNLFFYYIPVSSALERFINSDDYLTMVNREGFNDVNNGSYYRNLTAEPPVRTDVTLQFSTDGVSTFRSSNYSLWPIQLLINNLPQKLKRKYQLLCGLWFGQSKPIMDMYFRNFVDEMNTLNQKGLLRRSGLCQNDTNPIVVKFHVLVGVADSVARPLLQNISQFNGLYGCTYCLKNSVHVENESGGGGSRVYVGTDIPALRSIQQHLQDASTVLNQMLNSNSKKNIVIRGVKGPSVIGSLINFDITRCFSPDYMHSVLLGNVKTFAEAWFDSSNHEKIWYLGKKLTSMDKKFANIQPPTEITRPPRSLTTMSKWTASEWKNFLLYYSHFLLLDAEWPTNYLVHWCSLIYAIYIYLKTKISDQELVDAKRALYFFVENIPRLYGETYCKFNVHLLLHFPDWVTQFGGLWASSGFPFEDFNGILNTLFSNVTGIQQQICKRYFRWKKVLEKGRVLFPSDETSLHSREHELYNHLFKNHFRQYCNENDDMPKLSQKKKKVSLSLAVKTMAEQTTGAEIEFNAVCHSFGKFNGMVCHSSQFSDLKKRNNSYVRLKDSGQFVYIKNILVVRECLEKKEIVVIEAEKINCKLVNEKTIFNRYVKPLYHFGEHLGSTIVVTPDSIQNKCIGLFIKSSERVVIIPLVNYFEIGW
ncbi:uncharacterized protein LOC135839339 [Planococcus citri]|uniref:uncharacterized protein LOC135839339 n=1 Tax=Planococcus citri TaxID=170843 RepID=UPI0031FA0808